MEPKVHLVASIEKDKDEYRNNKFTKSSKVGLPRRRKDHNEDAINYSYGKDFSGRYTGGKDADWPRTSRSSHHWRDCWRKITLQESNWNRVSRQHLKKPITSKFSKDDCRDGWDSDSAATSHAATNITATNHATTSTVTTAETNDNPSDYADGCAYS